MTLKSNAIYTVYKPFGLGSNRCMQAFKKLLPAKTKVGFAGTLDPLASGVLPLATGKYTKMIPYLRLEPKIYEAEFVFGISSDTLDAQGIDVHKELAALAENRQMFGEQDLRDFLETLQNEYWQVPPSFSAKKINGKRSYDLARQGELLKLDPCLVDLKKFKILNFTWPKIKLELQVGAGFYVRSLVADIADHFQSKGLMSALCRTASGAFNLTALNVQVPDLVYKEQLLTEVIDCAVLQVETELRLDLKYGKLSLAPEECQEGLNLLLCEDEPIALVEKQNNNLKIIRNFV